MSSKAPESTKVQGVVTFDDPDIPPIYGYLPYGRYKKNGDWEESTPCQPSIIVMRAPDGSTYCMYEHPPGGGPRGKNEKRTLGEKMKSTAKNVEGSAAQWFKQVPKFFGGGKKDSGKKK